MAGTCSSPLLACHTRATSATSSWSSPTCVYGESQTACPCMTKENCLLKFSPKPTAHSVESEARSDSRDAHVLPTPGRPWSVHRAVLRSRRGRLQPQPVSPRANYESSCSLSVRVRLCASLPFVLHALTNAPDLLPFGSRTLTANIRRRRRSKVAINLPVYIDKHTPRPFVDPTIPWHRNVFPEDAGALFLFLFWIHDFCNEAPRPPYTCSQLPFRGEARCRSH
jgi:hypothetical protein